MNNRIKDFSEPLADLFTSGKYNTSARIQYFVDDVVSATYDYYAARKCTYSPTITGTYSGSYSWTGTMQPGTYDCSPNMSSARSTFLSEMNSFPTGGSKAETLKFAKILYDFFNTVTTGTKVNTTFIGVATHPDKSPISPAVFPNTNTVIAPTTVKETECQLFVELISGLTLNQVERSESDPNYPCRLETEEELLQRLNASSMVEYCCQTIGQMLDDILGTAVITVSSVGSNIATATPCVVV